MFKIIRKKVELMKDQIVMMQSFTTPETFYKVDRLEGTCTCQSFVKEGYCKHVEAVGTYKVKKWNQSSTPTFSQALSGLVKCIRLRNIEDAIYWLMYLDRLCVVEKGGRFRIARRLLIGSAEDGMSIAVMERVATNFAELCHESTGLMQLAAEIIRICKVPNWWHSASGGQKYIHDGMVSNRQYHLYGVDKELNLQDKLDKLERAIVAYDIETAMLMFEALVCHTGLTKTGLATIVHDLAVKYENKYAERLANIHLSAKAALSADANFIGQAIWWLAGGSSPVADTIEVVMSGEVRPLILATRERLNNPMVIPAWCCDGIHCGGTDRRFAGMWSDMDAVCAAFNHYGNVEPSNKWLKSFYSLDGLNYETIHDTSTDDGVSDLPSV